MNLDMQTLSEKVVFRMPCPPQPWRVTCGSLRMCGRGAWVHAIRCGEIQINSLDPSPFEAGMFQLVLRVRRGGQVVRIIPLLGLRARAEARPAGAPATWCVEDGALAAEVVLILDAAAARWVWRIRVANRGADAMEWDALYVQDIGLAPPAALRINEAYASHYVDHAVVPTAHGPVLLARQNQPQAGEPFPWLLNGCLPAAASFATDGMQVLGLDFRTSGEPAAWRMEQLPSRIMQYEMGCAALLSNPQHLAAGTSGEVRFFAEYLPNHPNPSGSHDADRVAAAAAWAASVEGGIAALASPASGAADDRHHEDLFEVPLLNGEPLDETALRVRWGAAWHHEERDGGQLLSFFTENGAHVVLGEKERRVERPHGHILVCQTPQGPEEEPLCSTVYAMGVFHSHLALGNPNFGRFLSVVRHPLNLQRAAGLRLFVKWRGIWHQLGVPSAFCMHARAAEWIYRFDSIVLEVHSSAASNAQDLLLDARVAEGPPLPWRMTMELERDPAQRYRIEGMPGGITIGLLREMQPHGSVYRSVRIQESAFDTYTVAAQTIDMERPLLEWTWSARAALQWVFRTEEAPARAIAGHARDGSEPYREPLTGGARISCGPADAKRIDTILPWLSHNALVHLSTPHGLEQFNGGAWGTRDVCQGPLEWMIATGRTAYLPTLMARIYAQQDAETHLWPQWFMFSPYDQIRQRHCHGDIVVWPLKALCDVLEATDDASIAEQPVAWMGADHRPRPATPLLDHVDRQLAILENDCIEGTALLRYRDGDWDDTLQPLHPEMCEHMASAWTVLLVFETVKRFAACARRYGWTALAMRCERLAERIHTDARRYLMRDGIIAGFVLFAHDGQPHLLVHPSDPHPGPKLRLLSINRGILSGFFTPAEAHAHLALLRERLLMTDGAHLMDVPVPYHGGKRTRFQRAETAAFFGREIALQYVHAHLRYCEAMALLGEADALVQGLLAVNPVEIRATVPHAELRQANIYFSSSDARFDTRADAEAHWEDARAGRVPVRGGWRLYSSGPGIFVGIVLRRLFGLRRRFDQLELDPVLPHSWNSVVLQRKLAGRPLRVCYGIQEHGDAPAAWLNDEPAPLVPLCPNAYRTSGACIDWKWIVSRLRKTTNELILKLPRERSAV